jgi:hypothetical protein
MTKFFIQSGIPESELRKREYRRVQFGDREPIHKKPQSIEGFLNEGGKVKVYKPGCSMTHKRKPFIELGKEEL